MKKHSIIILLIIAVSFKTQLYTYVWEELVKGKDIWAGILI